MLIPEDKQPKQSEAESSGLIFHLVKPWKKAWDLLVQRPDFRQFQAGFMLVGCGLMIIQPALPIFFVDSLHLSYTELAIALTLCKGAAFAAASPFWSQWMHRTDLFRLTSAIAALGCIFPLCLALTSWQMGWLYFAYIAYGIMQSGNELVWNMSGPFFSKKEDSSVFTSVNILAIGLRGCAIPALGSTFCAFLGAPYVMLFSATFCLLGSLKLLNAPAALQGKAAPVPAVSQAGAD
jgi:hypothetical protein